MKAVTLVDLTKTNSEKMNFLRQIFSFDIPLSLEKDQWLLVLTKLEFHISTFQKLKENFQFLTNGSCLDWTYNYQ